MASNYPPGVTGSEPEIAGYPDYTLHGVWRRATKRQVCDGNFVLAFTPDENACPCPVEHFTNQEGDADAAPFIQKGERHFISQEWKAFETPMRFCEACARRVGVRGAS